MTEILIPNDLISLYSKEYKRDEVALELGISTRTLNRYLVFAAQYIPDLQHFLDEYGNLNRKPIESHHIEYLREVTDLLKEFSRERVIKILTRKYLQTEE